MRPSPRLTNETAPHLQVRSTEGKIRIFDYMAKISLAAASKPSRRGGTATPTRQLRRAVPFCLPGGGDFGAV